MRRAVAVAGLVLLAVAACAQTTPTSEANSVVANIPFEFVAAGTTLPAGEYQFTPTGSEAIRVMNLKTSKSIFVPVITRLATTDTKDVRVTFDVMQGKRFLESVMPALDDGYLVTVTKEKHTHHTVHAG